VLYCLILTLQYSLVSLSFNYLYDHAVNYIKELIWHKNSTKQMFLTFFSKCKLVLNAAVLLVHPAA